MYIFRISGTNEVVEAFDMYDLAETIVDNNHDVDFLFSHASEIMRSNA